jgi:hypothetical protein
MRSLNLCSLSPGNCWRELVDSTKVYLPPQTSSCTANVLPIGVGLAHLSEASPEDDKRPRLRKVSDAFKEPRAPAWVAVALCRRC